MGFVRKRIVLFFTLAFISHVSLAVLWLFLTIGAGWGSTELQKKALIIFGNILLFPISSHFFQKILPQGVVLFIPSVFYALLMTVLYVVIFRR